MKRLVDQLKRFTAFVSCSYENYINSRALKIVLDSFENEPKNIQVFANTLVPVAQRFVLGQANMVSNVDKKLAPLFLYVGANMAGELGALDQIVGLQPMAGPVGMVYNLQYKAVEKKTPEVLAAEAESFNLSDKLFKTETITLEVVANAVMAEATKSKSSLSIEGMQDALTIEGFDVNQEIASVLAMEGLNELTDTVLKRIVGLCNTEVFSGKELDTQIRQASASIAHKTRRGFGNVAIMSYETVFTLPKNLFVPVEQTLEGPAPLLYVGNLIGGASTIKVFASTLPIIDNKVIVGYKGTSGAVDAGLFVCPHLLLGPTGVYCDPMTFTPQLGLLSRTGFFETKNASQYYRVIKIGAMNDNTN